jgi:hypothetical protein
VADVKFFFLVGGYDYEAGGALAGLDFDRMCTARVREWIDTLNRTARRDDAFFTADTTLRFIRFSVETGEIKVLEKTFRRRRGVTLKPVKEADWKPLSSITTGDAFNPNTFVATARVVSPGAVPIPFRPIDREVDYHPPPGQKKFNQSPGTIDIMSITDVYDSIHGAPENSVVDLSVFSHGWIQGPVLVNSSHILNLAFARDPDDKDGRAAVDFMPTMGALGIPPPLLRLSRFMLSFDSRAIMHTWGCTFDIETVLVQQAQKRIGTKSVADDTDLEFDFAATHTDWTKRYNVVDPAATFLPPVIAGTPPPLTITRKFSDLKKFLRRRLAESYAFRFMNVNSAPNRSAKVALPGTYAEDEKRGFKLMQVCRRLNLPECTSGFANVFDFYKRRLNISVDKRGYAIFDVPTMTKLKADIAADGS